MSRPTENMLYNIGINTFMKPLDKNSSSVSITFIKSDKNFATVYSWFVVKFLDVNF